ncbi:apolipoprotein N-acyltransferase [Anaeromyxobacter sp. PSR-1]|uniref:apolipoprotein N-acyltransferase n=1 Tax=unclassified Anaeromyxobacter TaxID=2620896 RepID=UPI0005E11B6A|nr:apolipoprotein N-acyltransferase [Anaeromyxobacter sp. PSR-1]GAO03473.1 apolipoprotein N-acyltransferase [Anaeromyxobacter sp. PSR-1]
MKRLSPYLLAIASGLALALALPLVVPFLSIREVDPAGRLELVAWVALVPAFVALRRARGAWQAARLGLAAGLAYFFAAIYWVSHAMTAFGGLSLAFSVFALSLLVLYMAAHWAGAFAVAQRVRARLGWPAWAVLPPVWVAFELSRNYLFSGFPWANVGYTQARTPAVAQLAAATGVYGIAALVVLVNAVLAEALEARRERRPLPRRALAGTAALVAAVVAGGALRVRAVRAEAAAAPSITVGVVQPNVDQSVKNAARNHREQILARLVPPTVEADRAGADLVAWPEAAYPLYVAPDIRSFATPAAGLPPLERAHVLLGATTVEWTRGAGGERVPRVGNAQFMVSPGRQVLGKYLKHHLVPFGEYVPLQRWLPFIGHLVPSLAPIEPGRELAVLEFPLAGAPAAGPALASAVPGASPAAAPEAAPAPAGPVRVAPMICYDAIFPEINVAFARRDPEPELLVNPTNDAWYGYSSGPYQFLSIVRMRAIEARRAVVRPAYAGVSAVILPTGELAPGALDVGPVDPELAPDPEEPARLLLARVPRLRGRTLYTTVGDLFAWASALLAAAALAATHPALARRVRRGGRDGRSAAA